MTFRLLASFLACGILTFLNACSRYSISINENVVYEPPPLLRADEIKDPALKACVRSTIAENRLTKPEQMKRILCPPGKITTLAGLETFDHLEFIGLSENALTSIEVLGAILTVQQIDLAANDIVDFSPLDALNNLTFLDAKGNANADCQSLKKLGIQNIKLPKHCE